MRCWWTFQSEGYKNQPITVFSPYILHPVLPSPAYSFSSLCLPLSVCASKQSYHATTLFGTLAEVEPEIAIQLLKPHDSQLHSMVSKPEKPWHPENTDWEQDDKRTWLVSWMFPRPTSWSAWPQMCMVQSTYRGISAFQYGYIQKNYRLWRWSSNYKFLYQFTNIYFSDTRITHVHTAGILIKVAKYIKYPGNIWSKIVSFLIFSCGETQ